MTRQSDMEKTLEMLTHTNALPHRQVWTNNILRVDKEDVTDVKVIGRHINAAQLFFSNIILSVKRSNNQSSGQI